MDRIGFIGLGVMGYHMALNVTKKSGLPVVGFDLRKKRLDMFRKAGGTAASDINEIYTECSIILQMLPTHETIASSIREAVRLGRPGNVIIDMSSADPSLIRKLEAEVSEAKMHLLDSPVSGGNPMAEAGTLSIMTGGEKAVFDRVRPVLECMGTPVYIGESGSGDTVKLINNIIGGAMLASYAEAYSLAKKAGLDLDTVFEATREGFIGGPLYENKIPKIIAEDFEPGARIAVHYKDIVNAITFAGETGMDLPVTETVHTIMRWMVDNGYADEDQAAIIRYFDDQYSLR